MRAGGARSQALPSPGCASVPARRRAGGARSQALPSPGCASVPARRRAGGARSQALPSPGCAGVSRLCARRRRALPGTAIPWVRGSQSPVCAPEARAPRHCHPLGARESVACVRAGGARSQALPSPGCAGVSRLCARRRRALPGTAIPWVRGSQSPVCAPEARAPRHCHPLGARESVACVRAGGARSQALPSPGCAGVSRLCARRRRALPGTAIPWVRQRSRPQARRRRALPGTATLQGQVFGEAPACHLPFQASGRPNAPFSPCGRRERGDEGQKAREYSKKSIMKRIP
jgi:hypothetical protein